MNYSYTTMDRVFSKVARDIGPDFKEDDIIEWTGEALEFIGAIRAFEEYVAFREIKNHQCDVPSGLHNIIQVAKDNRWTGSKSTCAIPSVIKAELSNEPCYVQKPDSDPCLCPYDDAVWLDCDGKPIVAYDLAYYRPFFDLQAEYFGWSNTDYYRNNFTSVTLKTSSFFNSLVCLDQAENIPYHADSNRDEYTIIQNTKLRFSFKEGFVAIAYNKQLMDIETGYPMIPDNISFLTAIVKYINLKRCEKDFDKNREGSAGRLDRALADWDWYCRQASNVDKMPYGIDEHQNLLNQRSYLMPRNHYYSFFGNMGQAEIRPWTNRYR